MSLRRVVYARWPSAAAALLALGQCLTPMQASMGQDTVARRLPPITVTVTREAARSPLDLPFAVSESRPDSIRPGQAHLTLEHTLLGLPGITVSNRTNPAQDPRISIRGFGARSAFGVRSVRILRDGMPLTLADGQTPVDYLDLESVGRVEVIRGAAASLYGNASGGVIDIQSALPPISPLAVGARSWFGDFDTRRYVGTVGGTVGASTYEANVGRTESENYRQYSGQRLTNGFARLTGSWRGNDFALQGLGLDMPLAENPGALTRAQFEDNPRMPDSAAVRKRARKTVRQLQLGMSARRAIGPDGGGEITAQVFGGTRNLYNPLTFAVVGVERGQAGAGLRATLPLGEHHRLTVGIDAARQSDARHNWANCNAVSVVTAACPTLPAEQGTSQLDQREIVSSIGPYVRDELRVGERLRLSAGVRGDVVRFSVRDRFLADGRDDSGSRALHAVSPMVGAVARFGEATSLYANVGTAFETPTTTELGNHADGTAGLNDELQPQLSTTIETGMKGTLRARVRYDVALFDTEVRNELISFEVPGGSGRTYFRNAGRTRRAGAEVSMAASAGPLDLGLAYTYSHFRFRRFVSAGVDYAGGSIPGIPDQQLQASIIARRGEMFAVVEAQAKSIVYVDDANRARAPSYAVYNFRVGSTGFARIARLAPVVSVQNLLDRRYVASVAVNAAGTPATGKFYEPGSGRTVLIGLGVGVGR